MQEEYTSRLSFRRWEHTFPKHKAAPPKGWHRYLRDGWSQNLTEWRKRYRLYLQSTAWKNRRAGALRRANHICAMCEQPSTRLHVHHVDYVRAGNERVEDLRVLCKPCHGVVHTMKKQPNIPLNELSLAHVMAREYRQRAKEYRNMAAALAAGDVAPTGASEGTGSRPRIRRRPKPEPLPEAPE